MSMIVSYELRPNIISDQELGLNALEKDLRGVKTMVSDGTYYSTEMAKKAEEKDVDLSCSALTGRNAPTPQQILDRADLVTEMSCIKHYMDKGVPAHKGVEK